MASSLTLANARALRAPRINPRGVTRASRRAAVVTRASMLTGKSVWIAEDGRKPTPSGGFTQDFLFDLGVPDHPTTPAPLSAVKFEAGTEPVVVTIPRPLGIVFEESGDGDIVVTEVLPEGNAARVGGVATGDVLRACSAMIPEMKYGQGNLLLGGNGRPGFRRVLFMVPRGEEYREVLSFDQTMGAVMSNAKAGDFDVTVVLERRSRG